MSLYRGHLFPFSSRAQAKPVMNKVQMDRATTADRDRDRTTPPQITQGCVNLGAAGWVDDMADFLVPLSGPHRARVWVSAMRNPKWTLP
jgi:hypothetical protein